MQIISREDARKLGLKRFYTGSPCQRGHDAERKVANKTCVVCCGIHFAKFYEKNSDRLNATKVAWYKENPEYAREAANKRRAHKRSAGGTYTKQDIDKIYALQKGKCVNCLMAFGKYHIDHIMPLALGGDNYPTNLQLLCPKCNQSKKDKHPLDWARKNGRLI